MARRSDPKPYAAIAVLVVGLLMAAFSGTCTLLGSGGISKGGGTPPERYQAAWADLFVYCGSLVFGLVLAVTALMWRELSGGAWSAAPTGWRLWTKRAFGVGFAGVALVMGAFLIGSLTTTHGPELLFLLPLAGAPATLFGYGAYRAWGRTRKVANTDEGPA